MSVLLHNIELYRKVRREFFNNCLWYQITGHREQKDFQEEILFYIFNLCQINKKDKVASMVHKILKFFFSKNPNIDAVFTNKYGTGFYLFFGKTTVLSNVKNKASLHTLQTTYTMKVG